MESENERRGLLRWIRLLLWGFVVGLILSGVTAFPLPTEVAFLAKRLGADSPGEVGPMLVWLVRVRDALVAVDGRYPFLAYGTDWLAFAHLVIAAVFIGPIRDPVRNVWVVQWGVIACAAILPLALICGPIREIPLFWQAIDCSFGVIGVVPLLVCLRLIRRLEKISRLVER